VALRPAIERLENSLLQNRIAFNVEALSVAVIALNAAQGGPNPFQVKSQ
jgi:hypothetical protein